MHLHLVWRSAPLMKRCRPTRGHSSFFANPDRRFLLYGQIPYGIALGNLSWYPVTVGLHAFVNVSVMCADLVTPHTVQKAVWSHLIMLWEACMLSHTHEE